MSSMSKKSWSNRGKALERAVFEVVWRRYKRGERDLCDGGVPPCAVAQELDAKVKSVSEVCSRLRDEGVFVELDGAAPSDLGARRSVAPAALYDGGDGR